MAKQGMLFDPGPKAPTNFDEFWAEYPDSRDKGMASTVFKSRIKTDFEFKELMRALKIYKADLAKAENRDWLRPKYAKTFIRNYKDAFDLPGSAEDDIENFLKAQK